MSERRRFLKMLGAAAIAVVPGCGSEDGSTEASGPLAAGNVRDLPVGSLKPIDAAPVVVGRDDAGFYAMTSICTHRQCDIRQHGDITSSGLKCSCHGAQFDRQGTVMGGPASLPLRHWKLEIDPKTGDITVHGGSEVPASERVPLPMMG